MKNFAIYAIEEQKMGIDRWMRKSDDRELSKHAFG